MPIRVGDRLPEGTVTEYYEVEDGVVTALHVEQPGKFEVSDAETMLRSLA